MVTLTSTNLLNRILARKTSLQKIGSRYTSSTNAGKSHPHQIWKDLCEQPFLRKDKIMKRRQFLRSALAGAAALLPNVELSANNWLASIPAVEPLMPIWEAAVGGHWGIVKEWLRRDPTLINVTGDVTHRNHNVEGLPLFHLASMLNPDVGVLEYLISKGADVNAKTKFCFSPLHFAAWKNENIGITQFLVSQGADVHAKNEYGEIALHWAAGGNAEVVNVLVSAGADVHAKSEKDNTPLHSAAMFLDVESARILITAGADVHAKNADGYTPLREAVEWHAAEPLYKIVGFAQILISEDANINAKDNDGNTPLHRIAEFWRIDVAKFFVFQGADVNAKNKDGKTPLDIANNTPHKFGKAAMAEYLSGIKAT
jgi:ankyrin repeat protein